MCSVYHDMKEKREYLVDRRMKEIVLVLEQQI